MRSDYTAIFQDAGAVNKYEHEVYAPDTFSSAVNRRQREYLRRLARREFPVRRPVQHDFACGTGRAIRTLHGLVRAAHGYDTSAAMLAKAGEVGAYAELHQVPADGPVPAPARTDGPALVTVFRLLLNVSAEVRERAIAFAAQALPTAGSGLLVVENHGNRHSLRHLRHRRWSGDSWFAELSHAEVEDLLARHGFAVVERRGFALLTKGWYARRWLRPVARLIDDLAARVPWLSNHCVNVLYVARRQRFAPPKSSLPAVSPTHPDATTW